MLGAHPADRDPRAAPRRQHLPRRVPQRLPRPRHRVLGGAAVRARRRRARHRLERHGAHGPAVHQEVHRRARADRAPAVDVSASSAFTTTPIDEARAGGRGGGDARLRRRRQQRPRRPIAFSDRVEQFVPPGKDRRHVLRILRELLYLEPQGRGTDIGAALAYLGARDASGARSSSCSRLLRRGLRAPAARRRRPARGRCPHAERPARVRAARRRPAGAGGRRDAANARLIDTSDAGVRADYARRAAERRARRRRALAAAGVEEVALRHRPLLRRAAAARFPRTRAAPRAPDLRVGVCVIRLGLKTRAQPSPEPDVTRARRAYAHLRQQ